MKFEELQNPGCRIGDISAYIDGELSPDAEIAFELHASGCADCRSELNLQKNLLRELDLCLTTGELELPRILRRQLLSMPRAVLTDSGAVAKVSERSV